MNDLPLKGIRVLDFTWVGAGPFLTKPLADHGADVIKVETRTRIDPIRNMAPFRSGIAGVNRSGYFANRNSSKRSICLNLKTDEGLRIAKQLIATSDVVVNNFAAGTMARMGLGYDVAHSIRNDIIFLEMPMMGNTGPDKNFRGFGLTIGAMSGFLESTGWPDRAPVGTGTNYPDHVPNPLHAAIAVLAALRRRVCTGQGEYIEISQQESTINAIGALVIEAQMRSGGFKRHGNHDPAFAPHGVYPCIGDDRWCAIAVRNDLEWAALCEVLGALRVSLTSAYDRMQHRLDNRVPLDQAISRLTIGLDSREFAARLQRRGVPAAHVSDAQDLLTDEQLVARGHWRVLEHPEMGPSIYDAPPYRLSRSGGDLRGPAPTLGQHSREVALGLLGLSEDEYEGLASQGVMG